eukprot:11798941-Ditylum_brightwellii.AAC.1
MTGATYDLDHKNNVFEYPELTCIHSKPTTANILTLCNKICDNAQAITTMLGDGANEYLGLVCNVATYAIILDTNPYTRPVFPTRTIPAGATKHIIAQLQEQYTKDL